MIPDLVVVVDDDVVVYEADYYSEYFADAAVDCGDVDDEIDALFDGSFSTSVRFKQYFSFCFQFLNILKWHICCRAFIQKKFQVQPTCKQVNQIIIISQSIFFDKKRNKHFRFLFQFNSIL